MAAPFAETARTIGAVCGIGVAVVFFIANPYHAAETTVHVVAVAVALVCLAILLWDHKPWTRFRRSEPSISYLDEHGNALCGKALSFFPLAVDWECHAKYGEGHFSRKRLDDKYAEWPIIQELSCRLFAHASFTDDTYQRLRNWLLTEHTNGDKDQVLAMPRPRIVELLRNQTNRRTQ